MYFKRFFHLETLKLLDKKKLVIIILFYLLAVYFIQSGVISYKEGLEEIKRFQEFEKIRIDSFQYYDQYGTYGFRLLYVPGPLSALFSNAGIFTTNLNAFIDSGERMKIYEPFKGKNAFIGYTSIFLNLSGLIFLLGTLLSLFYGFESFQDRDYLKFLDSVGSRKRIFAFLLVSRLLLILLCCLTITVTISLLYLINGLTVNIGHVILYGLVIFVLLSFFLLVGMLAGTLKSKRVGLISVFGIWLFFVFGLPAIAGKIVYNRSESMMSVYKMDNEKFKLLMRFEKKAKDEAGKMDRNKTNTDIRRKLFNYLWDNEFKEIMKYENIMLTDMKGVVTFHYNLSLIFPTTFFLSVNNEISGRGYENLIAFYEYALKHKIGFIEFYADKSFFSGDKTVKPYLRGNENIFHVSSLLPGNFGFGLVIGFFWVIFSALISWIFFSRMLDRRPDIETFPGEIKEAERQGIQINLIKENKMTVVFTFDPVRIHEVYQRLKGLIGRVVLVPGPQALPGDVKVKNLFKFFGLDVPESLNPLRDKFCDRLNQDDRSLLILEIVKELPAKSLIFDQFLTGLSEHMKKYFLNFLENHKKGRKIVYMTNCVNGLSVGGNMIKFANESYPI